MKYLNGHILIETVMNRIVPEPNVSSAQERYEKERFKVQPGSIDQYGLGKGSIADQERKKVIHWGPNGEILRPFLCTLKGNVGVGCGITKYASNHSYNPLTSSKSAQNLIMNEVRRRV